MEAGLIPYTAQPFIPCQKALVFAPHPDDETFGCGGLLAAYKKNGIPTEAIILTSGDHGEHGSSGTDVRESESQCAAKILGIGELHFWREPDRHLNFCERLIDKVSSAIKSTKSDLVLCPSLYEVHPDHRACAWLILEAARRLSVNGYSLSVAMYEIGTPLTRLSHLVDISEHAQSKDSAMACYQSQLQLQSYDDHIRSLNRYRSYTLGEQVKFAEAYWLIDEQDLRESENLLEAELLRQDRLGLSTTPVPDAFQPRKANFLQKLFRQDS
ncbi:MAG: PIG-L family deacetylase [Pseudohongiellaceae bacterium]|nr:PIG-L family deacetylase [Pseudohongiellaceae bacterium]